METTSRRAMRLALRALAEPPDAGSHFVAADPPFSTWKPYTRAQTSRDMTPEHYHGRA